MADTQVPSTRIDVRADPVAIERATDPLPVSHIPCTLNLFFDSKSQTAFLKFRLSVKTDHREGQSVYFLVSPEQIASVTVEDDGPIQDPGISQLCNTSRGTVRLRIRLSRAGSVVGPRRWPRSPSIAARPNSQACCNPQDVQWLGEQVQFTLYISCRTVSMVQLQELCKALSTSGLLKASTPHKDLARMYGGEGGKVIENFSLALGDDRNILDENDISTQSESPPPYDEAAAGPSTGPAGRSPGPEQRHSHKPPMKRRRPSLSSESGSGPVLTDISDPLRLLQDMCNKIWDERQARFRDEVSAELSRIEARAMRAVEEAEARTMHTLEERLSQLQDELSSQIEQVEGHAVTAAGDLIDEVFDDKITSVRVELEDFIRDELRDVEGGIWDQLEAGTWETSFMRRQEHRQT